MSLRRSALLWSLILVFVLGNSTLVFGRQWEAIGPFGGHALRVAIDPSNRQHLYAATKNGKIYQSMNAGERWEPLPFTLSSAASLSSFALNPKNSSQVFVGVARNYRTVSDEAGIYKSNDGGLHWTRLEATSEWSVLSLAIHPVYTRIVVAGTEQGVFRSDDGGLTWEQISPPNHPKLKAVVSVAIDPTNPKIVYAGTTHLPWKTSDGGRTWQSIYQGMADDSDVFSIAINSTNPQAVLIGACSGIYHTASAGVRWTHISGIPEQANRTHQVVQDPLNPSTFYAGTAYGLWKSVDGGLIWKRANPYPYVVNSIAIDPKDSRIVYLATDRSGLLKSTDGGKTFVSVNLGFVNRSIRRLPNDDILYIASLYEGDFGGIFMTLDQGLSWGLSATQNSLQGKNIISLAASPADSTLLVAGSYDGILRSTDAGKTWQGVDTFSGTAAADGKVHDMAFSRVQQDTIYVATDNGLFKSLDDGSSWERNPAVELDTAIYKLSLHTTDSKTILLQTSKGVLISRDGGIVWNLLNFDIPTAVYDFSFSRSQPGRILAATSRGLLYSDDDGRNFKLIQGGLPVRRLDQILSVPDRPEEMYVLSRDIHQMWRSVNGGVDWSEVGGDGLEGTTLLSMSVAGGQPFVVTESQGVFRLVSQVDSVESSR